jgi:hypothetical protein
VWNTLTVGQAVRVETKNEEKRDSHPRSLEVPSQFNREAHCRHYAG